MRTGARIEAGEEKEDPMDFVLWKASKPGEPAWESPWGPGRPGWHIECSAMSLKYLGDTLDIHGGGQDLVFPHHENEIAQSESFTGVKPFVRYWLHNGMVQLGEEKMSKSLGNLITIKEALQKYSADAIRIFALSSHYRSPLTYSEEILEAAEKGTERLRQAVRSGFREKKGVKETNPEPYRQRFIEAMDDDFNTAQALAALFDLAKEIHRADERGGNTVKAREILKELGEVLGLTFEAPEEPPIDIESLRQKIISINKQLMEAHLKEIPVDRLDTDAEAVLLELMTTRDALRKDEKWQLADYVRAKLDEAGITFEDTPKGTVWKRKR
jgi:cysteinyl-tRNA synthetase